MGVRNCGLEICFHFAAGLVEISQSYWRIGGVNEGALGDYGFARRVLPLAVVVDVAVDAGGAEYGLGVDAYALVLFEDGLEGLAQIAAALHVEAEGAGVAV